MTTASKSTLSINNLKILRAKVTKNLTNLPKKLYEVPSSILVCLKEAEAINNFLKFIYLL
jgi:hypothetical protein